VEVEVEGGMGTTAESASSSSSTLSNIPAISFEVPGLEVELRGGGGCPEVELVELACLLLSKNPVPLLPTDEDSPVVVVVPPLISFEPLIKLVVAPIETPR